jgi:hypothetical protein
MPLMEYLESMVARGFHLILPALGLLMLEEVAGLLMALPLLVLAEWAVVVLEVPLLTQMVRLGKQIQAVVAVVLGQSAAAALL